MRKLTAKKWSLLGLVLIAASAVTATVLPKNSINKVQPNGSLTASDFFNDTLSCNVTDDITNPCYASEILELSGSTCLFCVTSTTATANNTTLVGDNGFGS